MTPRLTMKEIVGFLHGAGVGARTSRVPRRLSSGDAPRRPCEQEDDYSVCHQVTS